MRRTDLSSHVLSIQEDIRNSKLTPYRKLIDNIFPMKTYTMCKFGLKLRQILPSASCSSHSDSTESSDNMLSHADFTVSDDSERLPGISVNQTISRSTRARERGLVSAVEINQWLEKESGMDRLRNMYSFGENGVFLQEDMRNLNTMMYRTSLIGFFVSVVFSAQTLSKKEKQLSRSTGAIKGLISESALPGNVLKEALKNTLRLTIWTATLIYMSQTIAAYRNKTSVWEYTISSAAAFGLMGVGKGLLKLPVFALGGAAVGLGGGFIGCKILTSLDLTQEQRHMKRVQEHIVSQRAIKSARDELQ